MPIHTSRNPVRCVPPRNEPGLTLLCGRLGGAGAADLLVPTDANPHGGLTAVHDATGVYTITLPGRGGLDVLCALFTCETVADDDLLCTITDKDYSARTIEVTITDGASAADLATGEGLHYMIVLKD